MPKSERLDPATWTIVAIHDTRQVEAQGDKIVRIPGSGTPRPCGHCGSTHEVWVTLLNDAGREKVVGTSCARGLRRNHKPEQSFDHPAPLMMARNARKVWWVNPTTGEEFTTSL